MRYLLGLLLFVSSAFADEAAVKALAPTMWLKSYKGLTTTSLRGVSAWANQGSVAAGFTQATAGNQPLVSRADNRENGLVYSEDLSKVAAGQWAFTRSVALSATEFKEDGTAVASHYFIQFHSLGASSTRSMALSLKVKRGTGSRNFRILAFGACTVPVDLGTGAIVSATGCDSSSISGPDGSGFYQVNIVDAMAGDASPYVRFDIKNAAFDATYDGDNASSIVLTQIHLRSSLADSTYTATTTAPEYRGVCNTAGNHCLPALHFDGVDDYMTSTATLDNIFNADAHTIAGLYRPYAVPATNRLLLSDDTATGSYALYQLNTGVFRQSIWDGAAKSADAAFVANTLYPFLCYHTGGNQYCKHGSTTVGPIATGNIFALANTLFLGSAGAVSGYGLIDLVELLTFDTALSAANQAVVEAYLTGVMSASADPWKRVSVLP